MPRMRHVALAMLEYACDAFAAARDLERRKFASRRAQAALRCDPPGRRFALDGMYFLIMAVFVTLVAVLPICAIVLSIIALSRSSRIAALESRLAQLESSVSMTAASAKARFAADVDEVCVAEMVDTAAIQTPALQPAAAGREPIQWEMFIGQKALGWIAVVLGIFTASFFLRYAYENNWIGPQGRVAIGESIGLVLACAGLSYHRRGWRLFARMLTACGIVVLYLSTYSAFGFYRLLPQGQAGGFMAAIVALSLIAAVLYDSAAIAFVSIVGGFLSPVLLSTDQDSYQAFFTYLAALNLGVALVVLARGWPGMASMSLAFTQVLFWSWYAGNYHPEKRAWAIGFQAVVYVLYLSQDLGVQLRRVTGVRWESAVRMIAAAICWFAAFFIILKPDYRPWMGSSALVMAAVYALIAGRLLRFRGIYTVELLTAVSLAVGFTALAIPLEAGSRWIAFGWAACAACLGWLSVRVAAMPLRVIASVLAAMSLGRLLFIDLDSYPSDAVMPILNSIALPSLGAASCLLAAIAASMPYRKKRNALQSALIGTEAIVALCALCAVLSVDIYHYFDVLAGLAVDSPVDWERVGRMSVSVLWTLYASTLLTIGFKWRLSGLRWLAIGFFGLTIFKVFVFDMAGLNQLYRIVAFLVLAVFLGLAARVYQRLGRQAGRGVNGEASSDAGP